MIEITENNFDNEIKDGIVLVDFWAPWCGPCKMLNPILERFESRIKIVKVNIDTEMNIAKRFNIKAVPTILIFNNKKIMYTYVGVQRYDTLDKNISMLESLKSLK